MAAYCRVSSTSDEQLVNYQTQSTHFENYIRSNPNYELAGIYADEGISGTDIRKREAFISMMKAARDGQIDLIITKSLSRFGRNTLDCLNNLRELKTLGVDVYFEKENIHTLRSEGEMLLTLIAAVAQNESLNQSENVKWGIHRQYERGNIKSIQSSKFLGYKKDKHGNLTIDEDQAATVRSIYQLFLNGYGTFQIAMMLTKEKVPMAYGGKEWCASHILKVLTNEKYQGDTRFQKTFNADYLTKRRVKNIGQLPQYYREDSHPAIIDRETWALVQLEITRQKQFVKDHLMDKFHHHSEAIPLSGKIICQACGHTLALRESFRKTDYGQKYWRCKNFRAGRYRPVGYDVCPNGNRIYQEIMDRALVKAWNELVGTRTCPSPEVNSRLISYRQARMKALLEEYGAIETMPYELILKVLDHVEAHADNLNVIFLSGNTVRVDLPKPPKPHPRWTHTRKAKTPMARRRMELGLTQEKLAELAGTARTYLIKVENGLAIPSPEYAQRINEILGMVLLE